jgi:hypothetical protein
MQRIFSALAIAVTPALIAWIALAPVTAGELPEVHVYKSPTCGCCEKWIEHLRGSGFRVRATDVPDVTPIKLENGVAPALSACHTAFVGGYVVEGHVPAADVHRLLAERPDVAGLAVPGMPIGSPGMEGPNPEPYEVLSFGAQGVRVFSKHAP